MFVCASNAAVLHADADAFFASVEQRDDPKLRGRPVIVGGGVVLAASYEARAFGIRGGMNGGKARRLCPGALVVPPRFDAYVSASKALFRCFRDTSPAVEGLSLEEAFLEVRGLEEISGSPQAIAERLRARVSEEVGLTLTVGVARTKLLAKMASKAAKPDGLLVVPPEKELDFLHPLPIATVWGIGPATATKLQRYGIATVGDLAQMPEGSLTALLGRAAGQHLHAVANNRDRRPVRPNRRRRSFGSQSAFGAGSKSAAEVEAVLLGLVDRLTSRMRAKGRCGRTVTLRLRFADFSRASRSCTLGHPTASTARVREAARTLLGASRDQIEGRGLTLVGIAISNLDGDGGGVQLELPLWRRQAAELDSALDTLRERYGSAILSSPNRQTLADFQR